MSFILYTEQTSERLSYIIDFFSQQISDENISITTDKDLFARSESGKINYSANSIHTLELHIPPHGLLFEENIQQQKTAFFEWNGLKAFFQTGGEIPFDIFSASFYLISRYEEWLPHKKDMYGRYDHRNSLAFKENFLHLPLVNLWIKALRQMLQEKFPGDNYKTTQFKYLPTYDIDIAYAYKGHSWWKNLGGFFKDMQNYSSPKLLERAKVLLKLNKDPFNTYAWLDELHNTYQLQPTYFFLVAEKRKGYDKNLSPYTNAMQQLIRQHTEKYSVGIHPSWRSGDDINVLKKEIQLLKTVAGINVCKSRQHYIRMTLPSTYRLLIDNGITEDYSMGYGSINGFRASVCSPFKWFDLERNVSTALIVFPFCYMEANSFFEQHLTATQAGEELQQYHDLVKSVGGLLITIFHNHFVTEQDEWVDWRNMYRSFLQDNFG